jgi:16S rRNA (cytosine967-C5)-methyltransferase
LALAEALKNDPRAVALDALLAAGDAAADLDVALRASDLSARDRALATEIAHGTLKMRRALEWSIGHFLDRPLENIDAPLRWILLSAAYQIVYLERVPAHSAVDQAVTLARVRGHRGTAGFANAVLRKVAGAKQRPPKPEPGAPIEAFATYVSLPDWIAQHLIDRFGFEEALAAAEGMNKAPRRALRAVAGDGAAGALIESLREAGVNAHRGTYGIPECLVVEGSSAPALSEALRDNRVVWQSEESQLAVALLDPRGDERILDVCAGRGVKTAMIARRLNAGGVVSSIDDDESKLARLRLSAASSQGAKVTVVAADVRSPFPEAVPRDFDAALVDAPCSGLGILGRRADARWRKRPQDPARFAVVQSAALRNAAERVKPGGRLLYVTCTTHPAECEAVVDGFLAEHGRWKAVPIPSRNARAMLVRGPYALTVPGIEGSDGFFYALLTRSAS